MRILAHRIAVFNRLNGITKILLSTAASLSLATTGFSAAFTPGNVVVYRVGNGGTLANTATNVYLDEYTTAGLLVQSFAMPENFGTGDTPNPLKAGNGGTEGCMTLAADGQSLAVPGYACTNGLTPLSSSSSANAPRTVAIVKYDGTVDTRTTLSILSGQSMRTATTSDGTNIWAAGGNAIGYATNGQNAGTVTLSSQNTRCLAVAGGQLYFSTGSGSLRYGTVGTGLPTTAGQTLLNFPGMYTSGGGPEQFCLLDLTAGVAGYDTLYTADSFGLVKYSLVGGNWTANATNATGQWLGMTATNDAAGVVTLFATPGAGGSLIRFVDTNGYNAGMSGIASQTIVTASAGTLFRGVAMAPQQGSGGPVTPLVSFSASTTTNQVEGNGPLTVDVKLSSANTGSVDIVSAGTATLGGDFTLSATHFDFTAASSTQTLTITLVDDAVIEATKVVSLQLATPTNCLPGSPTNFTFTLLDNDQPLFYFDATNAAATAEDGGALTVNIQVSMPANATIQVVSAGTALPGSDYNLSATQLVFTAVGATSQVLTVTVLDDALVETTELVLLNLANPAGGGLGAWTNFAFSITDNEPSVRFTQSSATLSETSGTFQVTIYKSAALNSVTGQVVIGGTAAAGGDYTISATNFTLIGAATSATINVTITDDAVAEDIESISLTLTNLEQAATGTPRVITLSIEDDDVAPALSPGDIAIIGRINNGNPDSLALLTLTNLVQGQVLYVTDNGWDSVSNRFRGATATVGDGNEEIIKLVINTNITAGTIISSVGVSPDFTWYSAGQPIPGATSGTFDHPQQAGAGDQLYAFQGAPTNPLFNPTTHLFVLDDTGAFEPAASANQGDVPPGLSYGFSALTFNLTNSINTIGLDMDRAVTNSFSKTGWLAYIAESNNWIMGASGVLPTGTVTVAAEVPPEMEVFCLGQDIVDGDLSPTLAKGTDFGVTDPGTPIGRIFRITNSTAGLLTISGVTISGANSNDFSVSIAPPSSISANDSATFLISFDPAAYGQRNAILSIGNNDPDENPYNFAIRGGESPDSDGDGLPDAWELAMFGDLNQTSTNDPDVDGFDNVSEYIAGTQATNVLSFFRFDAIGGTAARSLMFQAASGRVYEADWIGALPAITNWTGLGPTNVNADGPVTIEDPASTNGRIYRLRVKLP